MSTRRRHLRNESRPRRLATLLWRGARTGILITALLIVALPLATDYEWRTVVTGSMAPTIEPGDVILVAPVSGAPKLGDVVVFESPLNPPTRIVHRIVAFDEHGMALTQGDANNGPDPWALDPGEVLGNPSLTVPKVGFVVEAATSRAGIALFLIVPAVAIILSEIPLWYRFIRYGKEAFEVPVRGRHLVGAT